MKRKASAVWQGGLKDGKGAISTDSGVLKGTQYSFSTRFEDGVGTNPYPSEVEALVGAHPLVKDVAVIGLPDEKWGESVHAVIVLHDSATLQESDLIAWSKERMAGYKRPRSYKFIAESEMPRNATGKVLHRELKKRFTS